MRAPFADNVPESARLHSRPSTKVLGATLVLLVVALGLCFIRSAAAVNRTWDGGGSTNNWSEPANWSGDVVPVLGDVAIFDGSLGANSKKDCTIDAAGPQGSSINVAGIQITAGYAPGIITQAGGVGLTGLTQNFNQAGATFNGGTGNIDINGTLVLTGGTFKASSNTTSVENFSIAANTFDPNGGTFVLDGGGQPNTAANETFNNFTINKSATSVFTISGTAIVTGTLNLTDGIFLQGSLQAQGPVNVGAGFDGGSAVLTINGSSPQTISITAGANLMKVTMDAPNATIETTGSGVINLNSLTLQQGTINQGETDLVFNVNNNVYTQSGGTFNGSSKSITFNGQQNFSLSNGTFNGSAGNIDINGTLVLTGGTFKASSNTTSVENFSIAANTFNPNTGTFVLDGSGQPNTSADATFNNFTVNKSGTSFFTLSGTATVTGTLNLTDGIFLEGALQVQGPVVVGAGFDGGRGGLSFVGSANQTFANAGGVNPAGAWTIDKSGGTVSAITSMILVGTTQSVNIKSGTLLLNSGSNLTCGSLNLGEAGAPSKFGKLISDSSSTITLAGNVNVLAGSVIDLQGGGAACPQSDTILIRSSVNGTRRNWTGSGLFKLVDVDVRDMGGASATLPAITVFSGTNSGNNNSNWTFNNNCPTTPSITPTSTNVVVNTTKQFTVGGGAPPLTFSLAINNSGGSINSSSGLYTAGSTAGVTDTVRVTDSFGASADATVMVVGLPSRLAFVVQPSFTATAGQSLAPIGQTIQVAIQDQFGSLVTNATNAVTIAIQNNPGSGVLSGTATRNGVAGIASFDNLTINRSGSFYTLMATSGSLMSAASNPFDVIPGAPAQLEFLSQPTNTTALEAFVPFVQVAVRDALGNTLRTPGSVNIAIGTNPGGGTFGGATTSRPILNGVATFFSLGIDSPGIGYTLVASASGLSKTSNPFNITGLFEVTNTNNSGSGSLQHAIANVNNIPGFGTRTITFNIPGPAPHTIAPFNQLPAITRSVIVDGTTQPGFAGTPIVEFSCANIFDGAGIGLRITADNSTIKGLVINRCASVGIDLQGTNNTIQGNYIGTNVSGSAALGNGKGIQYSGGGNVIGGNATGLRNVISGNGYGIRGSGTSSPSPTIIRGNFIGTDATGVNPIPNTNGIETLSGVASIGGPNAGDGNVIAFSSIKAVSLLIANSSTSIRRNSIHSNTQLGIDISSNGVNLNDPADSDSGPNGLQNYPVLNVATTTGGTTNVKGVLNTTASSSFTVDFYSNSTCDPSGFGEGQTFLGSGNVSTDTSSTGQFDIPLQVTTTVGHFVTATATDSQGNTSEFSQCRVIASGVFSISGRAIDNNNASLSSSLVQLSGGISATTATDSSGNYAFNNVPHGGDYTVTITRPNYDFAPPTRTYTNLTANQINQNYIGTKTRFTLAGSLLTTINGVTVPLPDVQLTLSGTSARSVTGNVFYALSDLTPGNYTLTPSKDGFTFTPAFVDVTITNADQVKNFTATGGIPLVGRIIFKSGANIGSINADGTALNSALIVNANAGSVHLASDGLRLRYTANDSVCGAHADGHVNVCGVSSDSPPGNIQSASWSPDEAKVAFTRAGIPGIRILTNVETELPLGNLASSAGNPTWLSNTRIAFSANDGLDFEIYAANTDGSGVLKLTNNFVQDHYPVASPDGSRIAIFRTGIMYTIPNRLMVIDSAGRTEHQLTDKSLGNFAWSPDGNRIAFTERISNADRLVAVKSDDGSDKRVIAQNILGQISWGPSYTFVTPTGNNVSAGAGHATVSFGGVASAGTTTFTPIPPSAAGNAPNGFVIGNVAYEISTTAAYSAPVTVCFKDIPALSPTAFNAIALLHNEGGVLVDRTTSRTFFERQICGTVTTLSPFSLAEQILNLPSIHGIVRDNQGSPLGDVSVQLTGTEARTTQTDQFGQFHFVNLTTGNYNVHPQLSGHLFTEPSADLFGITGESVLAFIGTPASFDISGKALDGFGNPIANVQMNLDGGATAQTVTAANGTYSFTGLPAGGLFNITAFKDGVVFDPPVTEIVPLTSQQTNVDFIGSPATPSPTPTPTPTPPNSLNYTALGDSITFGLSDTQGGFSTRYQNDLQTDLSLPVTQFNLGVPGASSTNLLNSLQTDQAVRNAVAGSHVVTFNIGGNDLLPVIFQYQNAQCGGTDNLDCMRSALALLKTNLSATVAELLQLRATNNTVIRTMDFYNPFVGVLKSGDSWPNDGGLNDFQAIKPFADDINNFVVTLAAANRIPCARVSIAFNGPHADEDAVTKSLIADDAIHPSTSGHALIADLLRAAAYDPVVTNGNQPTVQIVVGDYAVKETAGFATISVVRGGNTSGPLTVDYATADGSAGQHDDYIAAIGRLNFAPGELLKTIPLLIVNDVNNEPGETFTLTLSNPSGGGTVIAPTTTNIVITNDDSGVQQPNPLEDARFYAQEHYFDFLNRFPDQSGWDFWTNEITSCGMDQSCLEVKRINVSAAFFLSIEFQETGYLIERVYKTAYGDGIGTSTLGGSHQIAVPIVRLNEFLSDTHEIGFGLVVGQQGWEQILENNKARFMDEFVQRTRFTQVLPLTMTPAQFVDQLNSNAGNPLSQQQRDQLVSDLTSGAKTRAQVLRSIAEDSDLNNAEFNRAFVLMQYFGYLRRNPNDQPDSDYTGYDFWLTKLNQFGGNFVNAEMVKAFILSGEYRHRFAP